VFEPVIPGEYTVPSFTHEKHDFAPAYVENVSSGHGVHGTTPVEE
jgi:hypothetical protein